MLLSDVIDVRAERGEGEEGGLLGYVEFLSYTDAARALDSLQGSRELNEGMPLQVRALCQQIIHVCILILCSMLQFFQVDSVPS